MLIDISNPEPWGTSTRPPKQVPKKKSIKQFFKEIICSLVFGHKFELDQDGRCLSDRKCVTCEKTNRYWR
jgi:hypothetical protein